jgi:hypothetical protein
MIAARAIEHAGGEAFRLVPVQGRDQSRQRRRFRRLRSELSGKISVKTHQMNVDYNSFEGFEIEGSSHVVTVRGKVAVRDGKFVGEVGREKFLERERTRFA